MLCILFCGTNMLNTKSVISVRELSVRQSVLFIENHFFFTTKHIFVELNIPWAKLYHSFKISYRLVTLESAKCCEVGRPRPTTYNTLELWENCILNFGMKV